MTSAVCDATQATDARLRLSVHYLPVDQLVPDPNNARVHDKAQIGKIAKSIQSFGFNVPILVDVAPKFHPAAS